MAAIKLTKGNPINLTKEAPGLKNLTIGLGWDLSLAGEAYDLDASVMITDENDRILFDDASLVFFNNPTSLDGAVVHTGDNRTGGVTSPISPTLTRANVSLCSMRYKPP